MRISVSRIRLMLFLAGLLALVSSYVLAEHNSEKAAADKKGAKDAADPPTANPSTKKKPLISYHLGEPLNGYYDWTVLRAGRRIKQYRYPLEDIKQTSDEDNPRLVQISCIIEFGSESGMAELADNEQLIGEDIRRCLERSSPDELLLGAGKRHLKEEIIAAVNRRLTTAQLRQLYWTAFKIIRI